MSRKSPFYLKLVLPFLGFGSLLWFLVRVVPKPGRAAYPCMRVATPLASTFVVWLLGLGSSILFFKQARAYFRKSQYAIAMVCVVAAAFAGRNNHFFAPFSGTCLHKSRRAGRRGKRD